MSADKKTPCQGDGWEKELKELAEELQTGAKRFGVSVEEFIRTTGRDCGEEYVEFWLGIWREAKKLREKGERDVSGRDQREL